MGRAISIRLSAAYLDWLDQVAGGGDRSAAMRAMLTLAAVALGLPGTAREAQRLLEADLPHEIAEALAMVAFEGMQGVGTPQSATYDSRHTDVIQPYDERMTNVIQPYDSRHTEAAQPPDPPAHPPAAGPVDDPFAGVGFDF